MHYSITLSLMSLPRAYLTSVHISTRSRLPPSPRTGSQLKGLLVLPPQCHNHLIDCGGPIADRLHGSSLGKQAITHRCRKIHFLSWCHTIGLIDTGDPELPPQGQNRIIACYTVSLTRGRTIIGVCIQLAMLHGYISQALSLHEDRGLQSLMLTNVN